MNDIRIELADAEATEKLGARLAQQLPRPSLVFLHGDLGAGKTTLVRGLLRGLGHKGAVRSPTYTLIEPYELSGRRIYHLDLYRLGDPEELEYIGIRDLLAGDYLCLVEWPQRGEGCLPTPDLDLCLEYVGEARRAVLKPRSAAAKTSLFNVVP
ncbi:tRNA (adenosine(37)-N6)-threonylcarbamoyltransferase complex ATPase subunit type 1 TsaE [Alkalilimnicola ehrlichii]|uniref:tRNA threonylcarbamoyladenosine biosynthesis protein TsaE n=1 Tax=Alkalilimnicola ehrlichii TaxID=351052 RepID=A0A3E0X0U1_9GAMM|nr:tRNA (adenosine(37)-N6)-threonylcarbamoyltransferase complex ATPase subunit type 1 TsaE [Alkalilimnicola ehrlichii]RFA30461.1 tRNA (adenosine(37)-N6)-threonylcarbamoyltransferase complex ATPase subunit type 1 TsaE [Alkalilimnicola ehrlichii]RFA38013.1 tRNA (adenosine(37)-N6)-threonylcarbamoyltransferase complex ATPase subunit type 1 TsaE [Alkalilimnicola ehrlichii]